MQLRYFLNENGKRVYTLEATTKEGCEGDEEKPTFSAHPARFSPDDKYSDQRIKCKKRFGVLKTQTKAPDLEAAASGRQRVAVAVAAGRGPAASPPL
eukprot:CAMPEP_0197885110 /NCGR_PEP_ID=MMETSP1439-20131203/11328_1 /TAXON_ID=66791 /ORGANISM="Gonyaulax spinifera, Strain CCMP409" /LENGTH=96 /DNA_ID=CAMNT_0043504865 /DNA_START=77 /DNA_END=368 /DNA_ORIENTATION=+